jgi:hypothetical protein
MIPVYQTLTVKNDGVGNCFNACVASILELPLRKVANILPGEEGSWMHRWRRWLGDHGYRLVYSDEACPPMGYSIATVHTERTYPDDHPRRPGVLIAHSCVAFDGVIVHDPYPLKSAQRDIRYYTQLVPLTDAEKRAHRLMVAREVAYSDKL